MLEFDHGEGVAFFDRQGRRYLEMIKLQLMEGDPAGMFAAAR